MLVDATAAHDEETGSPAEALSRGLAAILSRGLSELAAQSEAAGDLSELRRCLSSMSTSSISIGVAAASAESEGDSDVSGASSACDSEELEIQVAMSIQTTPAAPPAAADEGDYKVPRDWTAALVDATAAHDEETGSPTEALSRGLAAILGLSELAAQSEAAGDLAELRRRLSSISIGADTGGSAVARGPVRRGLVVRKRNQSSPLARLAGNEFRRPAITSFTGHC